MTQLTLDLFKEKNPSKIAINARAAIKAIDILANFCYSQGVCVSNDCPIKAHGPDNCLILKLIMRNASLKKILREYAKKKELEK